MDQENDLRLDQTPDTSMDGYLHIEDTIGKSTYQLTN